MEITPELPISAANAEAKADSPAMSCSEVIDESDKSNRPAGDELRARMEYLSPIFYALESSCRAGRWLNALEQIEPVIRDLLLVEHDLRYIRAQKRLKNPIWRDDNDAANPQNDGTEATARE